MSEGGEEVRVVRVVRGGGRGIGGLGLGWAERVSGGEGCVEC